MAKRRRVYTHRATATTQNVRCLVSINFGSTGWFTGRPTSRYRPVLLFFFFMGPYVCRARPRALICQLAICRLRFHGGTVSKHMGRVSAKSARSTTCRRARVFFFEKTREVAPLVPFIACDRNDRTLRASPSSVSASLRCKTVKESNLLSCRLINVRHTQRVDYD